MTFTMTDRDRTAEAAIHWLLLAQEQDGLATYEAKHGRYIGVHIARRETYLRTAHALRREAETGKPHCSTCGAAHPNHQHGYPFSPNPCRCMQADCPWCSLR